MDTTQTPEPATCPECGAEWNGTTCTEYFHELLALDHQRVQPFGRFHGLNVACYLLQHPSKVPKGQQLGPLWQMLTVYLSGGIEAVNDLERQLVAGGVPSFDAPVADDIPVPVRSRMPSITIRDVAAENESDPARELFPAAGYEDRMHLWVLSIAAERGLGAAA
ncbi:MAG TPA: hypothetical protein H9870_00025 [Candidatus Corynebacterium avicola]|uniref:Uncharacterized protein n=1 Tax=Candidatus Corynebacterium avicola TaxID=2838527 RepID=A0A9D1RL12_9CORY|nr:hypothetical protein [Candidatus Corynebacterium avicola]